eukprot:2905972-Ditylum_brightwellii.AAC.1
MKVIRARRLVPQAKKLGFISKVQFEKRKGMNTLDALLLKVTTMVSMRLFRLNGALLNNDAVACYDCVILALTFIHLQNLSLPEKAAEYSVKLNCNMKYYVYTTAGKPKQFYHHNDMCGIYGEGQGKGSSHPNSGSSPCRPS